MRGGQTRKHSDGLPATAPPAILRTDMIATGGDDRLSVKAHNEQRQVANLEKNIRMPAENVRQTRRVGMSGGGRNAIRDALLASGERAATKRSKSAQIEASKEKLGFLQAQNG